MNPLNVLHLSRAKGASDGGVATAVSELLYHQNKLDTLAAKWATPSDQYFLRSHIISTSPAILHLHGLWSSPNRTVARLNNRFPLIIAPHGMLDSWAFAHHYRRKRFLWLLYEYKLLQSARAIHALCDSEIREIRSLNITTPVALIPNGVDLPNPTSILPSPPWSGLIPQDARVVLFLGRYHSKKGIQPLIKAWHALASSVRQDNWWLVFVGYGDNGMLKQQILHTSIPNVLVCDPAFGTVKQSAFSSASAFVLPSYSEGLPMAALEAMSFRLPCLLSHACNLPDAFSCGAAQVAEPSVDSLILSFKQFFALSDCQRQLMGSAGFCLVKSRFSWSQVALQTSKLYQWINHAGPKPDFVHLV